MGFSASQEANYHPEDTPVAFSIKYALFDAKNFDNRIYSYERDLPGVFAMTPFYGQGSRISLMFKYNFIQTLSLQLKIGHSVYRDRQQVGTGTGAGEWEPVDRYQKPIRVEILIKRIYGDFFSIPLHS